MLADLLIHIFGAAETLSAAPDSVTESKKKFVALILIKYFTKAHQD